MDSRTEKKIEKALDRADREHDKAAVLEAKGRLGSADRHEQKAATLEQKAGQLAQGVSAGGPAYTGLSFPYQNSAAHPTYGYHRLPRDKKAERFEAKAVAWEQRGNAMKAQKNRDKALRHRQRMMPGYVPIAHPQPYYVSKADRLDQRALRYQQMGLLPQAQRYQQRALRVRSKHNVPASSTMALPMTGVNQYSTLPAGSTYRGLNQPYTGATQHPKFGYGKLTSDQKSQRYAAKAAEWERRGDLTKAQKNREKANRYRAMSQAGYTKPTRSQDYYINRATNLDAKAVRYQQLGRNDSALRAQQRAQRIRSKHNIPLGTGLAGAGVAGAGLGALGGNRSTYSGLGLPYTGATQHPKFGYQRLTPAQKAQRFELKAAEWQKRGNLAKANKNRDKANRYRMMGQPGYVRPTRDNNYYTTRAQNFDQRALRYQQMGRSDAALRAQQRAQRIRSKHNIPLGHGLAGSGLGNNQGHYLADGTYIGPIVPVGTVYKGLSHPYTGATAHPKFGYQRLTPAQKVTRFEAKAAEWERRGNLQKAQKNREKANRYRMRGQPGYVKPTRTQDYYVNRANTLDQRSYNYRQMGRNDQALRAQQRAQRIRTKHGLPLAAAGAGGLAGFGASRSMTPTTYSGINFPYTGAATHPTYGYQRLPHNKKAERFELKAAEWERRGNLKKAEKNRMKAQKYRARSQPGYVAPVRPQSYYVDRANTFDQRALQYQQWGMLPQAQRYQGRAQRVRAKRGLPAFAGASSFPTTSTTTVYPATYSGINFPYTGAAAHPTYGYQRLPHNKKAERFEAKAAEWERRGNLKKAEKNRMKAQKYRARSQPGYVAPVRPQTYYIDRANTFDQRALQYQQWGMLPQAQRYQGRAQRVRAKRGLPAYSGVATPMRPSYQYNPTATYSGLNFPYTGAAAHPTYGYQRLPHNKKAERFEAKAAEWERRGNLKKAEKNRMKAQKYRARSQPGYVAPVRPQTYYIDRANAFDQRALQYQQWGMAPQAQRYQGRAQRVRAKRGLPLAAAGTAQRPLYTTTATY